MVSPHSATAAAPGWQFNSSSSDEWERLRSGIGVHGAVVECVHPGS